MTKHLATVALFLAVLACAPSGAHAAGPWLDRVRAFEPGAFAGFGADRLPRIVRRRPQGLGPNQGSLDVVSLGNGGRITVSFDDNAVVDGDGDDLVIFENAFLTGDLVYDEVAFVEVSADGRDWHQFPFNADTGEGFAGLTPVIANSSNGLDPFDPASGGDRFDIADVGLDYVRFVRITDAGDEIDDYGNHTFPGGKAGFDLDAAGAIHSVDLGCISGIVTAGGDAAAGAHVRITAAGERRRIRVTHADGSYRVCQLRPGLDYDVRARLGSDVSATERVYIDEEQLRVRLDLSLP